MPVQHPIGWKSIRSGAGSLLRYGSACGRAAARRDACCCVLRVSSCGFWPGGGSLRREGFENTVVLDEGVRHWIDEGYPSTQGQPSRPTQVSDSVEATVASPSADD